MLHKASYYWIALIILLAGCRKDSDITIYDEYTTSTVTGYISADLDPIAQAAVEVNGLTTTTDAYGFFTIENVRHTGKINVRIKKQGYFPGSRTLYVNNNLAKFVKVDLIKKDSPFIFDGQAGGSLSSDNGLSLSFPANGVMDKDGKLYTGKVYVFTHFMDPTMKATFDEMPGTLMGVGIDNKNKYLQSYGMAGILLEDANGNALQVLTGQKVGLSMKIPDAIVSQAPETIPLWYYDEDTGLWKEEGQATKVSGNYEGYVAHFSFWNCDSGYDLATLKAKVLINDEAINAKVLIKVDNLSDQAIGFTDDEGLLYANVPANQPLTLQLLSHCDDVLLTQKITSLSINESRDLGTLSAANPQVVKFTKYHGTVTDCAGNPLTDGMVTLTTKLETKNIELDANGQWSYEGFVCNDNFITLVAKSAKDGKQSDPITLNPYLDNLNLTISACKNDLDEYIKLQFSNGESATLLGSFYTGVNTKGLFSESSRGYLQILSTYGSSGFPEGLKEWGIKTYSYQREGATYNNEKSVDRSNDIVHFVPAYKSSNTYDEGDFTIKNVEKYSGSVLIQDNITVTAQFRFKK